MMPAHTMIIPKAYTHPLYYKENDELIIPSSYSFEEGLHLHAFFYDIIRENSKIHPWEMKNHSLEVIFTFIDGQRDQIAFYFQNRDKKSAKGPMIKQIALIIDAVCWLNEQPFLGFQGLTKQFDSLRFKPMNSVDRIHYLLSRPDHYQSFIQLYEVVAEIKKIAAIAKMKRKKSEA